VGGPAADQVLRHIGSTIAAELELEWRDTLLLDAVAHVVAGQLVRHHARTRTPAARMAAPRRLTAAQLAHLRSVLYDRLDQPPTLTDMAAELGLTPARLGRALKRSTGLGPQGYITSLRLERARTLLRCSRQPLSEMALALGFCSQSHFTAVFHRRVGMTPAAFRAQFAD
jgi:AraC family transcriptional regulator